MWNEKQNCSRTSKSVDSVSLIDSKRGKKQNYSLSRFCGVASLTDWLHQTLILCFVYHVSVIFTFLLIHRIFLQPAALAALSRSSRRRDKNNRTKCAYVKIAEPHTLEQMWHLIMRTNIQHIIFGFLSLPPPRAFALLLASNCSERFRVQLLSVRAIDALSNANQKTIIIAITNFRLQLNVHRPFSILCCCCLCTHSADDLTHSNRQRHMIWFR